MVALTACGGGGGSGSSDATPAQPPGTTTPTGTAVITLKPVNDQAAPAGETFTVVLEGTWSASNLGAGQTVFLKVADSLGLLSVPITQAAPTGGTFRFEMTPRRTPWTGNYIGQLSVTPCLDGQCNKTLAAASTVGYRVDVTTLGEWETLNRDARHASYVPTSIDPSKLTLAWEWQAPAVAGAVELYIGRPSTTNGSLLVLAGANMPDGTQHGNTLYQLNEADGVSRWNRPVPDGVSTMSPGSNGAHAYLPTVGTDTLITAIDGNTGGTVFTYAQTTQPLAWTLAPSYSGSTLFFFAGTNGDEVHAASGVDGHRMWARPRVGLQSSTPTVDNQYLYYLAGGTIQILDRNTGDTVGSIVDPDADGTPMPGSQTVAIGSHGNLVSHAYRAGRGPRLSSYDIASRTRVWASPIAYNQFYAVAEGVIYATRNSPTPALDALDERTGQVLWSWSLPPDDQQNRFTGNVVATRDAVFLSSLATGGTASFVWAVDIRQHQTVWRYPEGGHIVISGNRTVYIASGPGATIMNRVRALRMP